MCWQISLDRNQMQHFRQKSSTSFHQPLRLFFLCFGREAGENDHIPFAQLTYVHIWTTIQPKMLSVYSQNIKYINISESVCWQTPSSSASLCCAIAMCRPNKYLYKYDYCTIDGHRKCKWSNYFLWKHRYGYINFCRHFVYLYTILKEM